MNPAASRLEVALKLKAARWRAGRLNAVTGKAIPLPVAELIAAPPLARNRVKVNRIQEIEQMAVDARPWELQAIVDALGLDNDYFTSQASDAEGQQSAAGEWFAEPRSKLLQDPETDDQDARESG